MLNPGGKLWKLSLSAVSFARRFEVRIATLFVLFCGLSAECSLADEVPTDLVPFLKYVVQTRAEHGLRAVVTDRDDPKYGTVYGGAAEDANIAWIAAAAYKYDWSRFHQDKAHRDKAFFLLDALARIHADGRWDDGGHGADFGLHSFAWAVLSWIESGEPDEARVRVWRDAVAAAADDALLLNHRDLLVADYANPDFYHLAGLAAAWKVTGDERYREEAAAMLRRYEDSLFDGGGVAYFLKSSPEHGYQQMVVKGAVLYWDLTGDAYALEWLKRLTPYFPNVQHRSGLLTDAEHSHLKHHLYKPLNPAAPAMLATALGDGPNRRVADIAAKVRADNVANRLPSFFEKNPNWYNFHHTTYAAAALRLMERHPLPDPVPLPARRAFADHSFRGVRSHWDDFTAAVGTRRMNDSLAGAYLADTDEPMLPLDSAVHGVRFEVLAGDRDPQLPRDRRVRAEYRCVEWNPVVHATETDGFAAVSCLTRLCSPYWADLPWIAGERWPLREVSGWTSLQHWAVWRDHLIGLGTLRCHADGGSPETEDVARVVWPLAPTTRKLTEHSRDDSSLWLSYGSLDVQTVRLAEKGGFEYGVDTDAVSPVLRRSAPWLAGDHVNVATHIHPAGSDGKVHFKALKEAAAALLLEPDRRKAYLWTASLVRHWRQHELKVPPGATVRLFKRDVEMPRVPPGSNAFCSLLGGESAVWVIESPVPLDPDSVFKGLHSGWGRGEKRPERD